MRRTADALVRVWYRTPGATDYLFGPQLYKMEVRVRGGGAGGQEELESIFRGLLPPGARLIRYELVA